MQPIIEENLFEARTYKKAWNTIHFMELGDIEKDINQLSTHGEQIIEQCYNYNGCMMGQSIRAMTERILRLKYCISALRRISPLRTKRGLFNIIGTGIKYLFGSMNADDAEQINADIDEVSNKTKGVATLNRNQTSLIQTTLEKLSIIKIQQETDLKRLERIATRGINETNELIFNKQILNSILELELHLEGTAEVLQDVEDAISEAKEGRISPRVVTPKNFMKALTAIKENLSTEMPFALREDN